MAAMCIALFAAAATTALVTPPTRRLATLIGAVDREGPRRAHHGTTPRLGGVPLAIGVTVGVICAWLWSSPWYVSDPRCWGLVAGATIILGLGIYDDIREIKPRHKLVFQAAAAGCAYLVGIRIETVALPFGGTLDLAWMGPPITLLWIVGVTNAMNLLDGIDGLAAGVTIIAAVAFLLIGGTTGAPAYVAVGAGATIGACFVMGFHTLRKRKMFLGDSGSLCLGFILANLALLACRRPLGPLSPALPLLALGLPVTDTLASIVRRALLGRSPFSPDRGHIHHALLSLGLSARTVVLALLTVSAAYGFIAWALATAPVWMTIAALPGTTVFPAVVYWTRGYFSPRAWLNRWRLERILRKIVRRMRRQETTQALRASAQRARKLLGLEYLCIRRGRLWPNGKERRRPVVEVGTLGRNGHPATVFHSPREDLTIAVTHRAMGDPLTPDAHEVLSSPVLRVLAQRADALRQPNAGSSVPFTGRGRPGSPAPSSGARETGTDQSPLRAPSLTARATSAARPES